LGDIYISSWMAREQAQSMGHPILRETLTLVAHGALHLLGYRDDTEPERKKMFRKQDRVLSQILP
jgi:probable rRNA maturation factor